MGLTLVVNAQWIRMYIAIHDTYSHIHTCTCTCTHTHTHTHTHTCTRTHTHRYYGIQTNTVMNGWYVAPTVHWTNASLQSTPQNYQTSIMCQGTQHIATAEITCPIRTTHLCCCVYCKSRVGIFCIAQTWIHHCSGHIGFIEWSIYSGVSDQFRTTAICKLIVNCYCFVHKTFSSHVLYVALC